MFLIFININIILILKTIYLILFCLKLKMQTLYSLHYQHSMLIRYLDLVLEM